jgi:hypothetical protein
MMLSIDWYLISYEKVGFEDSFADNNRIKFEMAYIKELIESLFDEESEGNI